MRRMMTNLFQIYVWLILYPVAWLWTLLISLSIILFCLLGLGQFAGRVIAPIWGRFILLITPVRVKVNGLEHINKGQSYVVVANHQSTYDIMAVYGFMPLDFKWVMKQELRKIPVVGFACEKMGHIYVDRGRRKASLAVMKAAQDKLVDGTSVFFFPEGTRSSGKSLKPFKKGAFRMARDLNLPILPLSIANADSVMSSDSFKITPGTITLTFHPAIETDVISSQSMEAVVKEAEERVASAV